MNALLRVGPRNSLVSCVIFALVVDLTPQRRLGARIGRRFGVGPAQFAALRSNNGAHGISILKDAAT